LRLIRESHEAVDEAFNDWLQFCYFPPPTLPVGGFFFSLSASVATMLYDRAAAGTSVSPAYPHVAL